MKIKQYIKIISLSLISSLLVVYAWEFKLFLSELNYVKKINYKIDYRKPFKYFEDAKINNEEVVMVTNHLKEYIDNKKLSIFPISGISKKMTIHCSENGYFSKYESDRYGFNNNDLNWDKDEIDYLFIGDSFVHGACVNHESTIVSKFKTFSDNNLNTINLGYSGSGPLIQLISLKEYSVNQSIKNIIWFFYEGNDLANLDEEIKNNILNKYFISESFSQNLVDRQTEIDTELSYYLNEKYYSYDKKNLKYNENIYLELIKNLIKLQRLRDKFSAKYRYTKPKNKHFEKVVKLIKNFASEKNANLFFVFLPQRERYIKIFFEDNKDYIFDILNRNEINIIDIDEKLFKNNDPLSFFPFRRQDHYNEIGYQTIAKILNKHIN